MSVWAREFLVFIFSSGVSFSILLHIEGWYERKSNFSRILGPVLVGMPQESAAAEGAFSMAKSLGRLAVPQKNNELDAVTKKLLHAGFRKKDAVLMYYGLRLGAGITLTLCGLGAFLLWGEFSTKIFLWMLLPFSLGYYLPGYLLGRMLTHRRDQISAELPDTLDLLMVCLKAGLGFDFALYRVCMELKGIAPVLSKEFGLYFLEVRSGLSRINALENLAGRNPSKPLESIVTVLLQSAVSGTDVITALQIYTDELRSRRRQSAEEKGSKLSTKLTLPLVVFILPALMLIILGPAIVNFINFAKDGF